jgi:hypothetical protein
VEIADRQQIGLAGRKPILRRRALTLWAIACPCEGRGRLRHELYAMRLWPQSSQRSTWPPSAAERHCSIAEMTWS